MGREELRLRNAGVWKGRKTVDKRPQEAAVAQGDRKKKQAQNYSNGTEVS